MIGFIGGSGIYRALPLVDTERTHPTTPYGDPSAPVTVGRLEGTDREIAFLPRHGTDHEHSPTDLPYRANLYALTELGVERVLASNAVGSLREGLAPRTLVVPDQLFDRTRHRAYSFFGDGVVVHPSFAEPFCPHVSDHLVASARAATEGVDVARGGTYVCIEGPQFSTRAESEFFRSQGWDVVGMTAVPEAKLAREAELCYATVAGVTDYDVWREEGTVTLEEVLENAAANETAIKRTVERAVRTMPDERDCGCGDAVADAINTPAGAIPESRRRELAPLIGDYLDAGSDGG